jgi:hypothetical protein
MYRPASPSIVINIANAACKIFFVQSITNALPHVMQANAKKDKIKGVMAGRD